MDENLSDAALLLIGHGSTVNADSAVPTYQHAAELRRRRVFTEVREAFWKQEPKIAAVLPGIVARRLFVVPLLISEGYFAEEAIPKALGFLEGHPAGFPKRREHGEQTLIYCGPVGTHPSMTQVVLSRAQEIVEKHPFPRAPKPAQTTLFIAGHGTDRNENSRRAVERQVEEIRAKGLYAEVHAVYMEEEPRIADCYALTPAKNLVVVPFFISDGLHSYEDIPVMLGEAERVVRDRLAKGQPTWRNPTEKKGRLVWYARSVGSEPHLADVILERVRQAAGGAVPA